MVEACGIRVPAARRATTRYLPCVTVNSTTFSWFNVQITIQRWDVQYEILSVRVA
jgi:hypothetical protein